MKILVNWINVWLLAAILDSFSVIFILFVMPKTAYVVGLLGSLLTVFLFIVRWNNEVIEFIDSNTKECPYD